LTYFSNFVARTNKINFISIEQLCGTLGGLIAVICEDWGVSDMKIDRHRDALIIVDLQNDFCQGGTLAVSGSDEIVHIINRIIPNFDKIYTTQDWHPLNHISFKAQGGPWPPHCVQGTKGAELHPGLRAELAEGVKKGTEPDREVYSGFQGTHLAENLRANGIKKVIVCGLATDYCVKATVIDAITEGFNVVVLSDAVRGVDVKPGDSDASIKAMRKAGAIVITSEELLSRAKAGIMFQNQGQALNHIIL
jgi:nicotinamidase/pyrazinamidase